MVSVGDKAPDFNLKNQNDEEIKLKNLKGQCRPFGFIDVITFDSSSEAAWIDSEKEFLNFISGELSLADSLFTGGFGNMFP